MKKRLLGMLALGGVVLPFGTAGTALASEVDQAASAGVATLETAAGSFLDAADGNGPSGADGVESEFPTLDPRYVEGPAGGLLNGPLD